MARIVCKHCGHPEDEHCIFEPFELPDGCECASGTWMGTDRIGPICEAYRGDGTEYCRQCEHDKACHKS